MVFRLCAQFIIVVVDEDGEIAVYYPEDGPFVQFNNFYGSPRGSLTIRKIVEDESDTGVFTFTVFGESEAPVDLTAPGISVGKTGGFGYYEGTDLPNGSFAMTRDTMVKIDGLEPDTYTIAETDSGYTTTYTVDGGSAETGKEAVAAVAEGAETVVEYTNLYKEPGIPFFFLKTDRDGNPLNGVEFALYACAQAHGHAPMVTRGLDGCWELFGTATSVSGTGMVPSQPIPSGDYMLVETETNPGLQLPLGQWLVHVEEEGITITGVSDSNFPLPQYALNIDSNIDKNFYVTTNHWGGSNYGEAVDMSTAP